jgi:hypothetical protein
MRTTLTSLAPIVALAGALHAPAHAPAQASDLASDRASDRASTHAGAWILAQATVEAPFVNESGRVRFVFPPRMLNGLETIRQDADTITAYRGSAVDNTAMFMLFAERSIQANIMRVGPGGRDDSPTPEDIAERLPDLALSHDRRLSATYRQGHPWSGRPLAGWYTPVYVGRADGSGYAPAQLILTRHQSSQRVNGADTLAIDEGFNARRNAPIAHYYDPATGFRPMICKGWPQPYCVWTRTDAGPLYIRRGHRGTGQLMEIDAREFVPPTGRLLRMQIVARGASRTGPGAEVSLFTVPRANAGLSVARARPDGDRQTVEFSLTSRGRFHILIPDGVEVDMVALGFSMLQPN